jgi:hypothetical protein
MVVSGGALCWCSVLRIINRMGILIRGLWVLSALGALAAVGVVLLHVAVADTTERQAHCAAVALAFAIAPYCLAAAVERAYRSR